MKPALRMSIRFILAAIAVYILFVGMMAGFQNKLLFIPSAGTYDSPESMGIVGEDVWFAAEDSVDLHGWYLPNEESDYVILFSHGNAGNIGMRTQLAGLLLESGASVFLYDYRGYGLSEGKPGEQGFYRDVRAAVRYLIEEKNIPENKIILYGRSLGGAVAAYAATEFNVAALVLDSAFTNLRTVVKDVYPFIPSVLSRSDFTTDEYISSLNNIPLMIFHSPEDQLIGFQHGEELFEYATEPKKFVELQGGHNNNYILSREIFVESWKEFLDEVRDGEWARRDAESQSGMSPIGVQIHSPMVSGYKVHVETQSWLRSFSTVPFPFTQSYENIGAEIET